MSDEDRPNLPNVYRRATEDVLWRLAERDDTPTQAPALAELERREREQHEGEPQ